jgi:hypothetical protein
MVNPVTILLVPISKIEFSHKYLVFSRENHFLNKIDVSATIDKWQFIKLRRTFSEIFFSIAAP